MKQERESAFLLALATDREIEGVEKRLGRKRRRLEQVAAEIEEKEEKTENYLYYLLVKREADRLERILRIKKRERAVAEETDYLLGRPLSRKTQHLEEFRRITSEYQACFPSLSLASRDVPMEYYVRVVALKYCGVVEMGSVVVETKPGALYFVRKQEVEHLLAAGMMKLLR